MNGILKAGRPDIIMGFWNFLRRLFGLAIATLWRWLVAWYKGSRARPERTSPPSNPQLRGPVPPIRRDYVPRSRPPPLFPEDNPIYSPKHPGAEYIPRRYSGAGGLGYAQDLHEPYGRTGSFSKDCFSDALKVYLVQPPYKTRLNRLYENDTKTFYRKRREAYGL